jgi:hypothetical protein
MAWKVFGIMGYYFGFSRFSLTIFGDFGKSLNHREPRGHRVS